MIPTLTFDDGPSEWTPAILDLLAEHGQRAAFFVIGGSIGGREETLERIHADGHMVGNHSFSHKRLSNLDDDSAARDLAACANWIEDKIGVPPRVWRPPFFAASAETVMHMTLSGVAYVGANVIPDDWKHTDPALIADRVLRHLSPEAIVCLHDGVPPDGGSDYCTDSRQPTVDALRLVLEETAT